MPLSCMLHLIRVIFQLIRAVFQKMLISSTFQCLKECIANTFQTNLNFVELLQESSIFKHFSKIASMIRKCHNHKPQTNPWHSEEEPHNNHETPGNQLSKATSSLFPIKMIAKLEWTLSNVQQNRTITDSRNGSNNKQ